MSATVNSDAISANKYLQDEESREVKHELINGRVSAMAGASKTMSVFPEIFLRLLIIT